MDTARQADMTLRWMVFLTLAIAGLTPGSRGSLWRMAPRTVDATITVGEPPGVAIDEQSLAGPPDAIDVPPFSVSIYAFPVHEKE